MGTSTRLNEKTKSTILLSGVDTLEVGYNIRSYKLEPEFWDLLDRAREITRTSAFGINAGTIEIAEHPFAVSRGRARWDYSVYNDDVIIYLNKEASNGLYYQDVHVVYSSPFLWRAGYREAVRKIRAWLVQWADVTQERVSRADICQDILADLPVIKEDWSNVKTRSIKRNKYSAELVARGTKLTGYSFGGGDLLLRIYDKTREIRNSHKEWFMTLWGDLPGDSVVSRVEYQLRRNTLRSFSPPVNTPDELFDSLGKIWDYLCQRWFRIKDSPVWWGTAKKYAGVEPVGVIERQHITDPEYAVLLCQAVGCITSCQALDYRASRGVILSQIDKMLSSETVDRRLAVKTIARSYI